MKIELGSDFDVTESEKPSRNRKKKEYLKVLFPDGYEISGFKTVLSSHLRINLEISLV